MTGTTAIAPAQTRNGDANPIDTRREQLKQSIRRLKRKSPDELETMAQHYSELLQARKLRPDVRKLVRGVIHKLTVFAKYKRGKNVRKQ